MPDDDQDGHDRRDIAALIVRCGDDRYAIAQDELLELVRADGTSGRTIEFVGDAAVFRRRGQLLPLVSLSEQLGGTQDWARTVTIAVLHAKGRTFGLVVDEVSDATQVRVAPLGSLVAGIAIFAGAAILSDDRVALVLDITGIADTAHLDTDLAERAAAAERREVEATTSYLVVTAGGRPVAVPLDEVERLEHMESTRIESSGHEQVVQYRGGIMPLVDLAGALGHYRDGGASDHVRLVVASHAGRSVGLIVDDISDIVELPVTAAAEGSAVVHGRVTQLVQLDQVMAASGHGTSW